MYMWTPAPFTAALATIFTKTAWIPKTPRRWWPCCRRSGWTCATAMMDCSICSSEDVTEQIRLPEISMYASAVSAIPEVRTFLLEMQRDMARRSSVIMDGRDIGTVVLPQAQVKIFLSADVEVRARRRTMELEQRGTPKPYEQVLEEMKARDLADSHRAAAPLQAAADAVTVDTTHMDFQQSMDAILQEIRKRVR